MSMPLPKKHPINKSCSIKKYSFPCLCLFFLILCNLLNEGNTMPHLPLHRNKSRTVLGQ